MEKNVRMNFALQLTKCLQVFWPRYLNKGYFVVVSEFIDRESYNFEIDLFFAWCEPTRSTIFLSFTKMP